MSPSTDPAGGDPSTPSADDLHRLVSDAGLSRRLREAYGGAGDPVALVRERLADPGAPAAARRALQTQAFADAGDDPGRTTALRELGDLDARERALAEAVAVALLDAGSRAGDGAGERAERSPVASAGGTAGGGDQTAGGDDADGGRLARAASGAGLRRRWPRLVLVAALVVAGAFVAGALVHAGVAAAVTASATASASPSATPAPSRTTAPRLDLLADPDSPAARSQFAVALFGTPQSGTDVLPRADADGLHAFSTRLVTTELDPVTGAVRLSVFAAVSKRDNSVCLVATTADARIATTCAPLATMLTTRVTLAVGTTEGYQTVELDEGAVSIVDGAPSNG